MEGIDNPINAVDDLIALQLELGNLRAGGIQLGFQGIAFALQRAVRVVGCGMSSRTGPGSAYLADAWWRP